jgi:CHAT domain-containing protein
LLLTQGRTREAQSILELLKVQELQNYGKDLETKSAPIQFPIHPLEAQALQTIEKSIASKQPFTLESLTRIGQPLVQNRDRITQEMNNSKITIGNPQALLNANPNAILIQNLVVADKLWVLWTNPNGNTKAIVVPNVNKKQLETTIGQFRKQIGNPYSNLNDLKTTSTQLYNWLIPAQLQTELAQTPKQQLIFSLDHVTRYIPVAALYDGKQYLTQRYSLSNIITTDSNMTDRLTIDGRSPTILALGTSKSYSGFSALPNVEAELKAIVKNGNQGIYPGKIQLNEAFTAQSLTRNLDSYRILHIATHGSFNPKDITASFLLLGNGDRLPITDIANLNSLSTIHLVVLSACETGISGAGQDGTEISGISGYFLRRGAKSVLASLWSVNDASTALIMQQFYQTLSQTKLTKAEALQKIQQDFISGKLTTKQADAIDRAGGRRYIEGQPPIESFAHPYFWAPFILTGNNQ